MARMSAATRIQRQARRALARERRRRQQQPYMFNFPLFVRLGRRTWLRTSNWPITNGWCVDCSGSTRGELYMVRKSVWELAWIGRRKSWYARPDCRQIGLEVLCIGCLERRIGRTLVRDDFPHLPRTHPDITPCNDPSDPHISERLRDRLTATESRRLRGRPRGSKNKPNSNKLDTVATHEGYRSGAIP
jgi:hypothetical protein